LLRELGRLRGEEAAQEPDGERDAAQ
jgi:hypothetical protein